MSKNAKVITAQDVISAHEAHGNAFLVIDLESKRDFGDLASYFNLKIRTAEGDVVPIRYMSAKGEGLVVGSRLKPVEQRTYEQFSIGFSMKDDNGESTPNTTALEMISNAFEAQIERLIELGAIVKKSKKPTTMKIVKLDDGSEVKPVALASMDTIMPIQMFAKSRDEKDEDGDDMIVSLDNPLVWISVPRNKFKDKNGKVKERIPYEDKYYPGGEKRIFEDELLPQFYDIEKFDVPPNAKVLKRVYEKIPCTNINAHEVLTRGTRLIGPLKLEMNSSVRGLKLDIALSGMTYLKQAEPYEGGVSIDIDDIEEFNSRYGATKPKTKTELDQEDEIEIEEEDEE